MSHGFCFCSEDFVRIGLSPLRHSAGISPASGIVFVNGAYYTPARSSVQAVEFTPSIPQFTSMRVTIRHCHKM